MSEIDFDAVTSFEVSSETNDGVPVNVVSIKLKGRQKAKVLRFPKLEDYQIAGKTFWKQDPEFTSLLAKLMGSEADLSVTIDESIETIKEQTTILENEPEEKEEDRISLIQDAILQLDSGNDQHWNKDGTPEVYAIETILGFDITASERDEAWDQLK